MSWEVYCRFRDRFAAAMDPRLHTIGYLDGLVWSGLAQCWATDRAAIVAKLEVYPTGTIVLEGLVAAGALDEIKLLIAAAERWGRDQGAALAKIDSRAGWVRALRDEGYAPYQTALTKEL